MSVYPVFSIFRYSLRVACRQILTRFFLKIGGSRLSLLQAYPHRFCAAGNWLSTFSLLRASLGRRRLRDIRGKTLPDESGGIADGKSNVVALDRCLDTTKLYGDTPVDR